MLQNPRLGAPAFDYLHFAMAYEWGTGWTLVVTGRRDGADQYEFDTYPDLDTPELGDVAIQVLELKLGL